jgi:hypothetical protein
LVKKEDGLERGMDVGWGGEDGDRLGQRLRFARERNFVGRGEERALFRSMVGARADVFAVLFVHGPGGMGKTALLQRFAGDARAAGRTVIGVDGGRVGASPEAFLGVAGRAVGTPGVVLLVDAFEGLCGLEGWLRRDFLPRLPGDAVVVVASRLPLDPGWRVDLGWNEALRVIALRALSAAEAAALLDARGVPADLQEPLLAFADGHPLALSLLAERAAADAGLGQVRMPGQDVIEALLSRLVGEVPSPAHRYALEVCAHAYRTTEELLRTVLPQDADVLFGWLRGLPFVESGPAGLFPHEVVRRALDADLQWRDPQVYEAMHRRIRGYLLDQTRTTTGKFMLHAVMGVFYLHRRAKAMPRFVTWRAEGEVGEEVYRPADRAAVLAMAAGTEGEESARIVDFWLARQPTAFYVHRLPETGEVVGFMAWLRLDSLRDEEIAADPVVAAAWEHSRSTAPPRPGEHIAVARFIVCPAAYQCPSPVNDLVQLRILAKWLRSEQLAWSYVVVADREFREPQMTYLDQQAVPATPTVAGRRYALFAHDWRAVPVESWLDRLIAQEISGAPAQPAADPAGQLAVLSRTEFDDAVRGALRSWRRADHLTSNPLTRGNLVVKRGGTDPVASLKDLLAEAVDTLAQDPRSAHLHKVVTTTFFQGVPTQEAAARRLGLPLSTYRRHLTRGIKETSDWLWHLELYGS